jgi:hypothetical protein
MSTLRKSEKFFNNITLTADTQRFQLTDGEKRI